ncbi:FecR domain-containing protein [Gilvimarinus sp. DA14]|uniref:FecR family protein n=1 Tax=Gilvimarinus sp. DA14 TaxID=2956798 RepID=UPI0020B87860|nr:FecR domain-containing protein [Gilvimarinus sp. DA14]UTF59470.1 FecR domain-containing protein [Gilvimarinus sp. DA14]
MGKVYRLRRKEDVDLQAAQWVVAIERTLTPQEERELSLWLSQSPRHRKALAEAADTWEQLDSLARLADLFPTAESMAPDSGTRFNWSVAASVALFLVFSFTSSLYFWRDWVAPGSPVAQFTQQFSTDVGEQKQFVLSDGSELLLNTDSEVSIHYDNNQRNIFLYRGELHITVAHDSNRPLRVLSDNNILEAVGTAFGVQKLDQGAVSLLVTDGRVKASRRNESSENSAPVAVVESIQRGQRLILAENEAAIETLTDSGVNALLGWRNGQLIFRGERLEAAIAQVSRYTDIDIVIADPNLKDVKIAGLFRAGDIPALLQSLQDNFSIYSETVNAHTIALHSAATAQ